MRALRNGWKTTRWTAGGPSRSACAALALLAAGPVAAQLPPTSVSVELTPVAPGIYAVLQPAPLRFDDGNAAVVLRDDGVLVVDTHGSPVLARAVIAAIRDITDMPVRWVVNTHWHGDHVQGNQAYRDAFPDVEVIAHEATARDIDARARPALAEDLESVPAWLERARAALRDGVADGEPLSPQQIETLRGQIQRRERYLAGIREVTRFVLPTRTFTDTLTLDPAGRIRLLHYEGHTEGDIVVWMPAARVLITGDLLDDLPYTGHGSPRALIETLHELEKLNFSTTIPGHGSIRHGTDHLHDVLALFESIVEQVDRARAAGLDADATARQVDVSEFEKVFVTDDASARYWPFFIGEAIRRAWLEPTRPQPWP